MPSKTSAVWDHFEIAGSGARCLVEDCKEPTIGSKKTSNLKTHLLRHHSTIHAEVKTKDDGKVKKKIVDELPVKQSKLTFDVQPKQLSKPEKNFQQLNHALAIAKPSRALTDFYEMEQFFRKKHRDYKIPSSSDANKRVLEIVAKQTLSSIKLLLKQDNITKSIVFDVWSDKGHSSYLGSTLHILDSKFELSSFFIGLYCLENGTDALQIRNGCEKLMARVGLTVESVDFLVTDNGSNIVAAFKHDVEVATIEEKDLSNDEDSEDNQSDNDYNLYSDSDDNSDNESTDSDFDEQNNELSVQFPKRLSCVDHCLELVTSRVVKNLNSTKSILKLVRKQIRKARKSSKMKSAIKKMHHRIPILPSVTRWSGNYLMLTVYLPIAKGLNTIAKSNRIKDWPIVNDKDLDMLNDLKELLEPFYNTIQLLQQQRGVTSSLVYGQLQSLIHHTNTFNCNDQLIKNAAQLLNNEMHIRFDSLPVGRQANSILLSLKDGCKPAYIIAAIMDPSQAFLVNLTRNQMVQLLQNELGSNLQDNIPTTPLSSFDETHMSYADVMKRRRLIESNVNDESNNHATKAINSYLDFVLQGEGKPAIDFWKEQGFESFPTLLPIAQKYLCLQATSASIERSFSHAELATIGRKNRTAYKLLDARLIVHLNRSYLEK